MRQSTGIAPRVAEEDPLPPEDRVVALTVEPVEDLYRRERPRLLRFFKRRGSGENAHDLTQQVFLRFAAATSSVERPEAYLHRTAHNLLIDEARRDRRQGKATHISADDYPLVAPDQLAALEARDMLRRLETIMLRLKPRTREIFMAHRLDGYSYAEIAARTGLSVKTVEKHMSRAIAYLDRWMSRS